MFGAIQSTNTIFRCEEIRIQRYFLNQGFKSGDPNLFSVSHPLEIFDLALAPL